jgi:hypothetical protein
VRLFNAAVFHDVYARVGVAFSGGTFLALSPTARVAFGGTSLALSPTFSAFTSALARTPTPVCTCVLSPTSSVCIGALSPTSTLLCWWFAQCGHGCCWSAGSGIRLFVQEYFFSRLGECWQCPFGSATFDEKERLQRRKRKIGELEVMEQNHGRGTPTLNQSTDLCHSEDYRVF